MTPIEFALMRWEQRNDQRTEAMRRWAQNPHDKEIQAAALFAANDESNAWFELQRVLSVAQHGFDRS